MLSFNALFILISSFEQEVIVITNNSIIALITKTLYAPIALKPMPVPHKSR